MSKRLVVAAIDFGTTYSGYAYAFLDDFKNEPLKMYTNSNWSDGVGMCTSKTPTVVLFDKSGKFHSFGYSAESEYNTVVEEEDQIGWKYFRRFKMELYKKKIKKNTKIKDSQNQEMSALEVFASAIGFLKDHLLERLMQSKTNILVTDIDWVLTVPAIWDDAAKQFMVMAAEKAGIPENHLSLAYEPEAAAIYCKESFTTIAREQNTEPHLIPFRPGETFMVIDLGGGTVDITAHEVLPDGKMNSLSPPSGGHWGGTVVDKHFNAFIENVFEKDVYSHFSKEYASDKLDLDRTIETKKRLVKPTTVKILMQLPTVLFTLYEEMKNKTIEEAIKTGRYQGKIVRKREKVEVKGDILLEMFNESKNNIITHVQWLLRKPELRCLRKILLVGGFAESSMIQEAFRNAFPSPYEVMVPLQPELAIVKGAVIFGRQPQSICSRKSPFAYGISTSERFDERKHIQMHKFTTVRGDEKCEDIFKVFVKKVKILCLDKIPLSKALLRQIPATSRLPWKYTNQIKIRHRCTSLNAREWVNLCCN